jgi:hypothetical protein
LTVEELLVLKKLMQRKAVADAQYGLATAPEQPVEGTS